MYRESSRDFESCFPALHPRLYHMGFRCPQVSRNTLANANEQRDWRIYADFAQVLIAEARALYAGEDFGLALDQTVYALDATVIDLFRDPDFDRKMREVLMVYQEVALQNGAANNDSPQPTVITVSVDEKPGVQAIGNTAPDLPPVGGKHSTVARDPEYLR